MKEAGYFTQMNDSEREVYVATQEEFKATRDATNE
jgi:hypothetical protein